MFLKAGVQDLRSELANARLTTTLAPTPVSPNAASRWIDGYRLLAPIGHIPPAEAENAPPSANNQRHWDKSRL